MSHWNHGSVFWGNTQYIIISTLQGVSLCEERYWLCEIKIWIENNLLSEYVVKHKSAKLFMMYAIGKLEAALNISHLILSTSSQRVIS